MLAGNHPFCSLLDEFIANGAPMIQLKLRGEMAPIGGQLAKTPHPGIYELTTTGMHEQGGRAVKVDVRLFISACDLACVFVPQPSKASERSAIVMPS